MLSKCLFTRAVKSSASSSLNETPTLSVQNGFSHKKPSNDDNKNINRQHNRDRKCKRLQDYGYRYDHTNEQWFGSSLDRTAQFGAALDRLWLRGDFEDYPAAQVAATGTQPAVGCGAIDVPSRIENRVGDRAAAVRTAGEHVQLRFRTGRVDLEHRPVEVLDR